MNETFCESIMNIDYVNWVKSHSGYFVYGRTQSALFLISDNFEEIERITGCLDDTNYRFNKYSLIVQIDSNIILLPDQSRDFGIYNTKSKSFVAKETSGDFFYTVGFVDDNEDILCFPFCCSNSIIRINKQKLELIEDVSYNKVLLAAGWKNDDGICVSPFFHNEWIVFAKHNSPFITMVSTDCNSFKNICFNIDGLSIEKISKIDDETFIVHDNSRERVIVSDYEGNIIEIICDFESDYEKNYMVYSFGDEECIVFLPKRGKKIYIYNRKEKKMTLIDVLPECLECYNSFDNFYFRGTIEGPYICVFPTLTNGLLTINKNTLKCDFYDNFVKEKEYESIIKKRILFKYGRDVMLEDNISLNTFIDLVGSM